MQNSHIVTQKDHKEMQKKNPTKRYKKPQREA